MPGQECIGAPAHKVRVCESVLQELHHRDLVGDVGDVGGDVADVLATLAAMSLCRWVAKPGTRDQLAVKVRVSRTCRAGAEHFNPTYISADQQLMEEQEDEVRRALDAEREEMEALSRIGSAMWRELVDDSD